MYRRLLAIAIVASAALGVSRGEVVADRPSWFDHDTIRGYRLLRPADAHCGVCHGDDPMRAIRARVAMTDGRATRMRTQLFVGQARRVQLACASCHPAVHPVHGFTAKECLLCHRDRVY